MYHLLKEKNYVHKQDGYGGIEWVLFAAFLGLLAYFFIIPTQFDKQYTGSSDATCYIDPPDASQAITDNGITYNLLKEKAPITSKQYLVHATNASGKTMINGKERQITKSFIGPDGTVGHGAWKLDADDKSANDLRFVDITDEIPDPTPGISYINIYLKDGVPIPWFVTEFCGRKPKIPDIMILPDKQENVFPPYTLDLSKIIDWHCEPKVQGAAPECNKHLEKTPRSGIYYLYSYDTPGSYLTKYIERTGSMPYGSIELTFNEQTTTYRTVFAGGWESNHIGLYGKNPDDLTQDVVYRYIRNEYLNLNTKNPFIQANLKKEERKNLQIDYFTPWIISHTGWWTPECKPAVYLYPEKEMAVNVKVAINNGFLTYTDPLYAKDSGWNVLAKPSGTLTYLSHNLADSKGEVNYPTNQFPYLYYEGKIQDSFAQKPDTGFIKSMDQLPSFFDQLLPKLGLNPKETSEFKDYWLKALPTSPYYFIGIIPQDQLDQNEPLTISPKENTMIRIRLFFEALEQPIPTTEPELQTPVRSGFTVVDWGGMVKQDKDHPFTCIQ